MQTIDGYGAFDLPLPYNGSQKIPVFPISLYERRHFRGNFGFEKRAKIPVCMIICGMHMRHSPDNAGLVAGFECYSFHMDFQPRTLFMKYFILLS